MARSRRSEENGVFESRLGTRAHEALHLCDTRLGRGAARAFLGAYFKIQDKKKRGKKKGTPRELSLCASYLSVCKCRS